MFRQRTHQTEFWLSYAAVATIERRPGIVALDSFHRVQRTFFPVVLQCRLPFTVKLLLPTAQAASDVAESLHGLVYAKTVDRLYGITL
jgi:hypothetical protein